MTSALPGWRPSARDREILLRLADRVEPGDGGGHNNLGVLYHGRGMTREAVEAFHRALEIDPTDPVAARNLEIAYLTGGTYEAVVRELEGRIRVAPEDREARLRLARAHRYTGRLERAAAELQRLLAIEADDVRVLHELGEVERARGRADEARTCFERALELDPASAVLHHHLGALHYHEGRTEAARRHLERAVTLEPALAEGWHTLAFVLGDLGRPGDAREALSRGRELRPNLHRIEAGLSLDRDNPAIYRGLVGPRLARPGVVEGRFLTHYHLGIALRQKGHHGDAVEAFRRGRESGEATLLYARCEAEALLLAGRDAEAAELYRHLLGEDGANPKLHNELAVCHHRAGALDEAETGYRRALSLDAGYTIAANNLGVLLMERGDPEGAREVLGEAAGQGQLLEPLYNLGLIAAAAGDHLAALRYFREAVEMDPDSPSGWTGVGGVLADLGRLAEARRALARAVELGPERAETRYRLGFVLHRLGENEASLRETKRALMLDPYFTAPRLRLAIELQFENAEVLATELSSDVRLEAGAAIADFTPDRSEVDAAFERLLRPAAADARPPERAYQLAEDYLAMGLQLRALAEIRRVARAGGDFVEAALLSGELFLRRRLEGEALERLDEALHRLEGADWSRNHERAWLGRGRALLGLGRGGEARRAAEIVLSHAPGEREGRRLLADAHLACGDAAGALDVLRTLAAEWPDDVSTLMRFADAAEAAGEPEVAHAALHRVIEIDPDRVAARVDLGGLLLAEGDHAGAAEQARLALEVLPGYIDAALLLAEAEEQRGDPNAAVALIAEVLEEDPYHLRALERLAVTLTAAGRVGDAAVAYRRLLRFDPESDAARAGLERSLAFLEGGGAANGGARAIVSGAAAQAPSRAAKGITVAFATATTRRG